MTGILSVADSFFTVFFLAAAVAVFFLAGVFLAGADLASFFVSFLVSVSGAAFFFLDCRLGKRSLLVGLISTRTARTLGENGAATKSAAN